MSMKPIQVFVTNEEHKALKVKAARNATNVSEIVRKLIKDYVA
jgi:hypothetical protein